MRRRAQLSLVHIGLLVAAAARAQMTPQIVLLSSPQLWQRFELRITNVPAATNPFDPSLISLDLAFSLPSGKTNLVPAFWYQNYQRGLSGGSEYLTLVGSPEWRARFTPSETGAYTAVLTVRTNGQLYGSPVSSSFTVPA